MILAVVWIVIEVPGGITAVVRGTAEAGKMTLVASIPEIQADLALWEKLKAYFCVQDQVTLLAVLVSFVVGSLGYYTVDQTMVQRYLSTRDLANARGAFWLKAITGVMISLCLTLLGMSLLVYYDAFPVPSQLAGFGFSKGLEVPVFHRYGHAGGFDGPV